MLWAKARVWRFYIFIPILQANRVSGFPSSGLRPELGVPILHLSPFSKGIEALRKLRAFFCGRGSSLVCTTPPVVPLAKGGQTAAAGRVGQPEKLTLCKREACTTIQGCCCFGAARASHLHRECKKSRAAPLLKCGGFRTILGGVDCSSLSPQPWTEERPWRALPDFAAPHIPPIASAKGVTKDKLYRRICL